MQIKDFVKAVQDAMTAGGVHVHMTINCVVERGEVRMIEPSDPQQPSAHVTLTWGT